MSDPVQRFRKLTGRRRLRPAADPRPSVPPREYALVSLLLVNVLWLVFALGGVRLWGELTALGLALSGLFLLPRWNRGELQALPSPVSQLLRLPLFWFGLGLYLYFFIQSWNLAWDWTVIPDGRPRLVSQTPPVPWLPAGLEAPFSETHPLRSMIFYTIPWLSACSAWAGLGTRRSILLLLNGLALVGTAFGILALWQHFKGMDQILGIFPTVPSRLGSSIPFWGTLINSNHGAFYLILSNGLCLGLFLSGWKRDLHHFRKGGGAWLLYLGLAILTTFAILMAQARAAIILVAFQWTGFFIICSVFMIRSFGARGALFPGSLLGLLLITLFTFVINPDVFERQKTEWEKTFQLVENPELEARYYMMQITWDMIADKPWYGHGAGSFPYLHLPYKAQYPEFRTQTVRWKDNPVTGERERRTVTIWFKNAHVDLLEYLVEWGIIGCLFPLLALSWFLYRGLRALRGWDAGGLTILFSLAVVFLGAFVEFHFRIPLVLLTWSLALTATVKLASLQAR